MGAYDQQSTMQSSEPRRMIADEPNFSDDTVFTSTELARFMKENPNLFRGKVFTQNTISNKASLFQIPAMQHGIKGGVIKKIHNDGKFTFELGEIINWCKWGANKAAVYKVLKGRDNV
jgi:hypothetical protein